MVFLAALISILFVSPYLYLLQTLKRAWDRIVGYSVDDLKTTPFVSVIIVARNEEENIIECLQSIENQNYPPDYFEILLFDDFSSDATFDRIHPIHFPHLKIFRLGDFIPENQFVSGKKMALEIGVEQARGTYILVTDADSACPPDWIRTHVCALEKRKLNFITGPVYCKTRDSFIGQYQALDLAALIIITGGGFDNGMVRSANGANMGFRKTAFNSVGGYKGYRHLASGDDIFLLQKMESAYSGTTGYNKNKSCMVETRPQPDFRAFIRQRTRWASKAKLISHMETKLVLGYMMTYYLGIAFSFILAWINPAWIGVLIILLVAKMVADLSLVRAGLQFTGQEIQGRVFILAELFQVFYSLIVGTSLLFRKSYTWKDRRTY
jgi:cellulose synthase/poly-beta-1,6-N-acetylglucosamine synthase-like glycosyltransferase